MSNPLIRHGQVSACAQRARSTSHVAPGDVEERPVTIESLKSAVDWLTNVLEGGGFLKLEKTEQIADRIKSVHVLVEESKEWVFSTSRETAPQALDSHTLLQEIDSERYLWVSGPELALPVFIALLSGSSEETREQQRASQPAVSPSLGQTEI